MLRSYARTWWMVGLRGLLSIVFGVLILTWPEITVEAFVPLFGTYALVNGTLALIWAVRERKERHQWRLVLLEGIAGVAFGVATIGWPRITALVLVLLTAGWAAVTGILQIVVVIFLRKELEGAWLVIFSGILLLVLGVLLAIHPKASAITLIWLIGAYAVLFGGLLIVLAF